jgi:hypothetical protein
LERPEFTKGEDTLFGYFLLHFGVGEDVGQEVAEGGDGAEGGKDAGGGCVGAKNLGGLAMLGTNVRDDRRRPKT